MCRRRKEERNRPERDCPSTGFSRPDLGWRSSLILFRYQNTRSRQICRTCGLRHQPTWDREETKQLYWSSRQLHNKNIVDASGYNHNREKRLKGVKPGMIIKDFSLYQSFNESLLCYTRCWEGRKYKLVYNLLSSVSCLCINSYSSSSPSSSSTSFSSSSYLFFFSSYWHGDGVEA